MSAVRAIVVAMALLRLVELLHARRNAAALLRRGGVEIGAAHYPLFVLLHAGWLLSLFFLVPAGAAISWPWLAVLLLMQAGRLWAIRSLGPWWTTRVITVPDAPLVRRGPYRFLRHPNYVVVVVEIAALPLAFGAWRIALVFSLLNAALLAWRIHVEEQALAPRRRLA
ncbi:MAG TPA: isoprenylcysteine carboxylmethyltransferase family protein [Stellaceae bacterium]|nr:isoprenylcysteine carboxylmethyltransferase family protein [Stellaceae bacterium]